MFRPAVIASIVKDGQEVIFLPQIIVGRVSVAWGRVVKTGGVIATC